MSEENKKEKLPEPEDVRIEFILNYVMKSMRIKIEKWSKLMSTVEYKIIILDWLNNVQRRTLIISINLFGFLLPTLGFPSNSKGKSCYFIKKELIELTEDNLRDTIIFGDLSINPINDFSILLNDIFYPLISNVENQREWPIEIYQDMNNQMYELKNRVAEIKGHIKNEIILPLPMNIDEIVEIGNQFENGNPIECDLNVKNALEGIVIKWSYQINDILVSTPLNLFKENSHPLPLNLYKFWNLRHLNLENIFQQLSTPKIKLIGHILETINSVYYSSFESTFKATVKSLNESRNIVIYLNALQKFTETFESNDFIETYHLIKPLLHCIGLMWANSLYYCTNEHWQTLFKIISNLMIYESIKYLDSSTMFQSDADEQLYKINDTINLLTYFRKESINLHKNLKSFQIPETNPIFWSFDQTIIFERFDLFMIRLNDIKLMFETTTEFLKLERIELGGLKGRNLSRRLTDIYVDYQKLYSKWNAIKFDPLNLNTFDSYEFDKLKLNYQHKSDSIVRKLAQVLIEAFEDCYNVEDCIKFIEMFGTLLNRPIVDIEMKNKYNKIVDYYTDELELIENCYLNGYQKYVNNGLMCVSKNFSTPPIIDTLKWIKILCQRINNPLQELPYIEIPVFENNEKGILVIKRKGDLLKKLTEFEYKILFDWCENISNIITTNMHKFLLNRNLQNLLELNFGDELEISCKEIKLIKMFDYENLPEIVDEIYELLDRLWKTKIMLSRITEWYNYIRVNAETCEYQMIADEIIIIDKKLYDTIDSSCWSNYDQQYIEDLYNIIGSLYKRIINTRENIQIILKNIKTWGSIPLYERNNNNKNNNNNNNQQQSKKILNIIDRKIRIDQRSQDISKTNDLIKNIMYENYCLFFDLPMECHGESTATTDINADPAETSTTYDEHKILFKEYEKYIDGLVSEALLTSITLRSLIS